MVEPSPRTLWPRQQASANAATDSRMWSPNSLASMNATLSSQMQRGKGATPPGAKSVDERMLKISHEVLGILSEPHACKWYMLPDKIWYYGPNKDFKTSNKVHLDKNRDPLLSSIFSQITQDSSKWARKPRYPHQRSFKTKRDILELKKPLELHSEAVFLEFGPKSTTQIVRDPKHKNLHKNGTNDNVIKLLYPASQKWLRVATRML